MKKLEWLFLLLLVVGCRENSVEPSKFEIQEEPYTHRWRAFYEIKLPVGYVGRPMKFVINGRFTNISKIEYEAYPVALVAFGRTNRDNQIYELRFEGGLGYTATEDWGMGSTHEERFQLLSLLKKSIKPKEMLRIKVLSPWFIPADSVFIELVHVINGVQDISREQVTW